MARSNKDIVKSLRGSGFQSTTGPARHTGSDRQQSAKHKSNPSNAKDMQDASDPIEDSQLSGGQKDSPQLTRGNTKDDAILVAASDPSRVSDSGAEERQNSASASPPLHPWRPRSAHKQPALSSPDANPEATESDDADEDGGSSADIVKGKAAQTDGIQAATSAPTTSANDLPDEDATDEGEVTDDDEATPDLPAVSQAPLQQPQLTQAATSGNVYAATIRDGGYADLLDLAWKLESAADRPAMRGITHELFYQTGLDVIAAIPAPILLQLMGGNLALAGHQDDDTLKTLIAFRMRGNIQPSIYMRLLVDGRGASPTPDELHTVISTLREYALPTGAIPLQHIVKIDTVVGSTWPATDTHKGRRRYLSSTNSNINTAPKQHKIEALKEFCDALESNLQALPSSAWDEPLQSPLKYIGYAKHAGYRNDQHSKHSSSNFLMDLVEAVCLVEFRQKYTMRYFVISLICQPDQAQCAEMLLTTITDGYSEGGAGFAHHSAGESAESRFDLNPRQWSKHCDYILDRTPYLANLALHNKQVQARIDEFEQLGDEIKALNEQREKQEADFEEEKHRYAQLYEEELRDAKQYIADAKNLVDTIQKLGSSKPS